MKNKKGFTLVELLAVIVILALIMGIAVVSIGGVLNSARQSTFKETAVSIINGVRQQLTLSNSLPTTSGRYFFEAKILEKGGDSPLGGSIQFVTGLSNGQINVSATSTAANRAATAIGNMGVYRDDSGTATTCGTGLRSYVTVTKDTNTNVYTYSICLTAGEAQKYIDGTETELLDSNNTAVIK